MIILSDSKLFSAKILGAIFCILLFYAYALIFAFVPINQVEVGTDLWNYLLFWDSASSNDFFFAIQSYEVGFATICYFFGPMFSFESFLWLVRFLLLTSLISASITLGQKKIFIFFYSLCVYFFYPPFESLESVAIRQGIAVSILFIFFSLHYFDEISWKKILFLSVLLTSFHYSAIIVFVALIAYKLSNKLLPFIVWVCLTFLYIFNLPADFLEFILSLFDINLNFLNYLYADSADYILGFKLRFLLLNVSPLLFVIAIRLLPLDTVNIKAQFYSPVFRIYFLLNSIATFFTFLPYNDRFFLWSWSVIPLSIAFLISSINFKIR